MNKRRAKIIPLVIISLISSAYIFYSPLPRSGLDLLGLIPLTYSICVFFWGDIFDYHKGGVGLKILYLIMFLRFVISPLFVILTNGETYDFHIPATRDGYIFAVFSSVFEIVIAFIAIKMIYGRVNKQKFKDQSRLQNQRGLSAGGLIVLVVLTGIILARDFSGITAQLGFLWMNSKYSSEYAVDSYAITAIQVIKSFLFVELSISLKRFKYDYPFFVYPVVLLLLILNIGIYFGYNRSLILQTAVASIFFVVYLYPELKKVIIGIVLPLAISIVFTVSTIKQFNTPTTINNDQIFNTKDISVSLENYVCGVWPIAISYDASISMRSDFSLLTPLKDATDNFFPFKIPGLSAINEIVPVRSTVDLYQEFTYPALGAMLPMAGLSSFYGGDLFTPFYILVMNLVALYMLIVFEIKSKRCKSSHEYFYYGWLSSLFGLFMCYSLITLLWSYSKFALFLAILFYINNHIVFMRGRKNEDSLGY